MLHVIIRSPDMSAAIRLESNVRPKGNMEAICDRLFTAKANVGRGE